MSELRSVAESSETPTPSDVSSIAPPDAALAAPPRSPLRHALTLLAIAVGAFAVCLFFHAPNLVYWSHLHDPLLAHRPEINRAISTEVQIEDPFAPVENPSNRVIRWRLLFPLIAHYTHMPFTLYLTLPYVGALLLLAMVAHVVQAHVRRWSAAALAAVLVGSLSWFAVGTGWLAYFDAWYVLGLVVVAFVPSRFALCVAALGCVWIDERFVFGLPGAMAVRAVCLGRVDDNRWRPILLDAAVVIAGLLPHLALRLPAMITGHDAQSVSIFEGGLRGELQRPGDVAAGAWNGLALAWGLIALFLGLRSDRRRLARTALLWIGLVTTLVFSLVISGDPSRTVSMLTPAVVAGVIVACGIRLWRDAPRRLAVVLGLIVVTQLLLPTKHVFGSRRVPIVMLPTAIGHYWRPDRDPVICNDLGVAALRRGDLATAATEFDRAVAIDPSDLTAVANRAVVRAEQGDLQTALREIDDVLRRAPPDWPHAAEVRAARRQIDAQLIEQRPPPRVSSPRLPN
ncbi:MAG: hypothetical protein GC159_01550 [Phycisphaera sp.]|nr:hypothetical protein [Phycisphaera sp.]